PPAEGAMRSSAVLTETLPLSTAESTAAAALKVAVATEQRAAAAAVNAAGGVNPSNGAEPTVARKGAAATVNPSSGTAGTAVTISATGFPANTRIDLYLAGLVRASAVAERPQSYATATTDGNGNATLPFVLPTTWPSGEPILTGDLVMLVATQDFATRANTAFAYTAPTVPTATPTAPPTVAPTATNTETPVPIPSPTPTNTPIPALNPFVDADPTTGAGGTRVTLHGGGFGPGATVNVYLGTFDAQIGSSSGNNVRYAAITADGNGYFTVSFGMPSRWPDGSTIAPGLLLILAETNNFAQQASAVFDYLAPTPTPTINPYARVEPPAGSAGTEITISGGGFPANTRVDLYLAGLVKSNAAAAAARPNSYASATTDGNGDYVMRLSMPATWPDGRSIETGRLALLVASDDFRYRASASFDYVVATPTPVPTSAATATPIGTDQWEGRYYNNPDLRGDPVLVRGDRELRFNWGSAAPDPNLPNDDFSVRWQRTASFERGVYRFTVEADDGFRLYVDETLILESWRPGSRRTLELDYPMEPGNHLIRLDYFEDKGVALVNLRWALSDHGWYGSYFNNRDVGGDPVLQRYDSTIDFDWGTGSPDSRVNADDFSVRWLRRMQLDGGVYRLSAKADDGVRVWINDDLVLDGWQGNTAEQLFTTEVHLGGGDYAIRVDYQENRGNAAVQFELAAAPSNEPAPTATPVSGTGRILFDSDPRNNRRGVNPTFCSGFESECNFGNCPENYRLVWGPYCRESDYPYIKPGLYRITLHGSGTVRAGATDYGATDQLFGFAEEILTLPGSYTFCWPGKAANGYGFETVVQSTGDAAAVTRITVEYLGENCR
ncbi:MAG: hypothetical protein KDE53_02300, partial [Caldilineaceae bacterium]|nr:hypothetical protein [Caldilineaceae bacterium]